MIWEEIIIRFLPLGKGEPEGVDMLSHKSRIHNFARYKQLRKILRNHLTDAEAFLWSKLKNNYLGRKFRRQHGIGDYIVDFYCPENKLVIELDGEVHREKYEEDIQRDDFLKQNGLKVVRYRNEEVMKNIEGVLEDIKSNCKQISPPWKEDEDMVSSP